MNKIVRTCAQKELGNPTKAETLLLLPFPGWAPPTSRSTYRGHPGSSLWECCCHTLCWGTQRGGWGQQQCCWPACAAYHRGTQGCSGWLWDTWCSPQPIPTGTGSNTNTAARDVAACNQKWHQRTRKDWKSLLPPAQKTVFEYKNFLFRLHFYIVEASQTAPGYQHKHQTYRALLNAPAAGPTRSLKAMPVLAE